MSDSIKPLWSCPKCGHQFVTANIWHSCGRYELEPHFNGRSPIVQEIFDDLVAAGEACGPVTVYPQKSRIVFMVRVRFASVMTRKKWLYFSLWLTRRIDHSCLTHTDVFGSDSFVHRFRLSDPSQIDQQLEAFICEAYQVGRQEHLKK